MLWTHRMRWAEAVIQAVKGNGWKNKIVIPAHAGIQPTVLGLAGQQGSEMA
ncbi:MAG TPA: hypothetical protein VF471_13510 [Pseudoxanthomonas sp.]